MWWGQSGLAIDCSSLLQWPFGHFTKRTKAAVKEYFSIWAEAVDEFSVHNSIKNYGSDRIQYITASTSDIDFNLLPEDVWDVSGVQQLISHNNKQ